MVNVTINVSGLTSVKITGNYLTHFQLMPHDDSTDENMEKLSRYDSMKIHECITKLHNSNNRLH